MYCLNTTSNKYIGNADFEIFPFVFPFNLFSYFATYMYIFIGRLRSALNVRKNLKNVNDVTYTEMLFYYKNRMQHLPV